MYHLAQNFGENKIIQELLEKPFLTKDSEKIKKYTERIPKKLAKRFKVRTNDIKIKFQHELKYRLLIGKELI